jgi:hypothetical protein
MTIRGLDPQTGEFIYLAADGAGSEVDPKILIRKDPIAHAKLDALANAISSLFPSPQVYNSNPSNNSAAAMVKTSSGYLCGFSISNYTSTTCYLQFFNLANPPEAGNSSPQLRPFVVYAGSVFGIGSELLSQRGVLFGSGISYGISSTRNTFTPVTQPGNLDVIVLFN